MTRRFTRRSQRGSGTVLSVMIMLGLVGIMLVSAWSIGWITSFHRAHRIADLAAVAGAHAIVAGQDGCAAAKQTALRNGGEVITCTLRGEMPSFVLVIETSTPLRPVIDIPTAPLRAVGAAAAGQR